MPRDGVKLISLICPVYNEEAVIPIFLERLRNAIAPLRDRYDFELLFTNDGSTDRTMELITAECARDEMIKLITFSRNFGYQASVLAGLEHAAGDGLIIIAVDCEDPPEMIPRFIEGWEQGYDIVYGRRDDRPESRLIKLCRKAFYRLTQYIADSDFVPYMAEFSLFTRRVRDVILANGSTYVFIRSDIAFAGFGRLAIPYSLQPRAGGKSHYNIWAMFKFAISSILTSSTFPLRLAAYVGVPLFFLNSLVMLAAALTGESPLPAWLIGLNLNFIVLTAVFLAIYLARVYKDGMHKPRFVIDWNNSSLRPPKDTVTRHAASSTVLKSS